jgi:RNA polymerase sigma-70 factor (ECF subfamily)
MPDARNTIEAVVRQSYSRLVSFLAARFRDVASAEDALSEAFVAALRTWPTQGVPSNPEAWLLRAAKHRLIDRIRHAHVHDANVLTLRTLLDEAEELSLTTAFPDERLKLLFVCAHPAIDARIHTPLMLQTVLGLDADSIAEAFLVPGATMSQRLARAKTKIRDTHIAFEVPTGKELSERLSAVLEAVYATYNRGWEDVDGSDIERSALTDEAIWLARMAVELLPDEPEALGLLSLFLHCEARRPARRGPAGEYVPISEQDVSKWNRAQIIEAEQLLSRASSFNRPGRFQLEAAIQSAHAERLRHNPVDWVAIALLYEGVIRIAPTFGAMLGRAAAVAEAYGPAQGLRLLDALASDAATETHQSYWATRGFILQRLGRSDEAVEAFQSAMALTRDPVVSAFLRRAGET